MVAFDTNQRATLEEVINHPWLEMDGGKTNAQIKTDLAAKINEIREQRMRERAESSVKQKMKEKKGYRAIGTDEDEFNMEADFEAGYKNASLTEWSTCVTADEFWEALDENAQETSLCELQKDEEKKKFTLTAEDKGLIVKLKFYIEAETKQQRVQFLKKSGSLVDFLKLLKQLQELMEPLLAPEN
jgi:hypothetical protein